MRRPAGCEDDGVHAGGKRVARVLRRKGPDSPVSAAVDPHDRLGSRTMATALLKRACGPDTVELHRVSDILYTGCWAGGSTFPQDDLMSPSVMFCNRLTEACYVASLSSQVGWIASRYPLAQMDQAKWQCLGR